MTFGRSKRAWAYRGQDRGDAAMLSPTGRSSAAAAVLLSVTEQPVVTLYDAQLELHGLSLSNQTKGRFVFVSAHVFVLTAFVLITLPPPLRALQLPCPCFPHQRSRFFPRKQRPLISVNLPLICHPK